MTAPTCPDCGAELVGTTCTPAADRPLLDLLRAAFKGSTRSPDTLAARALGALRLAPPDVVGCDVCGPPAYRPAADEGTTT